jgi:hypothetical protein
MYVFEPKSFKSAQDFVDALRPTNPDWGNDGWQNKWCFRGQGNADWKLVPSAFRQVQENASKSEAEQIICKAKDNPKIHDRVNDAINRLLSGVFSGSNVEINKSRLFDVVVQAYVEYSLIGQFVTYADSLGFRTPDGLEYLEKDPEFFDEYIRLVRHLDSVSRDREALPYLQGIFANASVALAQHHGIPTRLLDWTRKPLYAAFFALEAIDKDASQIAVFALRQEALSTKNTDATQRQIDLVTVPKSDNAYLNAQDGIFTLDIMSDYHYLMNGTRRSLEEVQVSGGATQAIRKKLLLPISEARELYRLLTLEGVSRAHLMPGLDNVAKSLKTQWSL